MKNIIIGLVGLLILLIGIFVYVKIKDNDSIDNLNIAIENNRAGTEQLLGDFTELKEQLDIYASRIAEIEQRNSELGNILARSEQYSAELEQQLTRGIESSLTHTSELSNINSRIENGFEESLQIIRELEEYDFGE